jgi:hypothetical protein
MESNPDMNIGIKKEAREEATKAVSKILASSYGLYL